MLRPDDNSTLEETRQWHVQKSSGADSGGTTQHQGKSSDRGSYSGRLEASIFKTVLLADSKHAKGKSRDVIAATPNKAFQCLLSRTSTSAALSPPIPRMQKPVCSCVQGLWFA